MKKLKIGIIGMGLIGASHIDAVRRIGFADIMAVADTNFDLAQKKAEEYFIPICYRSVDELIARDDIDVIHNCTPNNLHFEINEKVISAGKHIFSEKPLSRTSEESARMLEILKRNPKVVNAVNFNYRMNPLVQEIKNKIKGGEIGIPRLVHGSYLQDWLLYDTDYNWRIEPDISGESRAVADIGSHWMDSVQTVLGTKITEVCADLVTVLPVRKKPKTQAETFTLNTGTKFEEKTITTEDYGAVLFKMGNGMHGVFYVSQISAGRGCYLNFEIDGSKASVYWNQETADHMWMGSREGSNQLLMRNPNSMHPESKQYTHLAKGHPEGWNDAFKNNIMSFYKYISEGKVMGNDPCDFATFENGHYIMKLIEAILESSRTRQWTKV